MNEHEEMMPPSKYQKMSSSASVSSSAHLTKSPIDKFYLQKPQHNTDFEKAGVGG